MGDLTRMQVVMMVGGLVRIARERRGRVNGEGLGHVVVEEEDGLVVIMGRGGTVQRVEMTREEMEKDVVDDVNDLACAVDHYLHQVCVDFDGGRCVVGGRGGWEYQAMPLQGPR